jgi:hypothetical protein
VISIHLPASVSVIGKSCFCDCGSLVSITFESGSQLSERANWALRQSGLTSIHLPASASVLGERCLDDWRSLVSITFDPASEFCANEADLFAGLPLGEIHLRDVTALLDD